MFVRHLLITAIGLFLAAPGADLAADSLGIQESSAEVIRAAITPSAPDGVTKNATSLTATPTDAQMSTTGDDCLFCDVCWIGEEEFRYQTNQAVTPWLQREVEEFEECNKEYATCDEQYDCEDPDSSRMVALEKARTVLGGAQAGEDVSVLGLVQEHPESVAYVAEQGMVVVLSACGNSVPVFALVVPEQERARVAAVARGRWLG